MKPAAAERLGIFGGTFNPPHLGHVAAAGQARSQLGLDRVLLVPVHSPPHKPAEDDAGPVERLAMCELIASEEPGLEACALEIERGGPSYTVDTLRELHERDPEAQLTLIVGADMARTLARWRESEELFALADIAVAGREGVAQGELQLEGARVSYLAMENVPVSSSLIRERRAAGEPIESLVGERVAEFIEREDLYFDPLRASALRGSAVARPK